MNIVLIVQARMGSARLPGKVLLDLSGEPMLARVVNRAARAKSIDQVVVATTEEPQDDPIASLCNERGWHCFRGEEDDVLDRYYQAARSHSADIIVRVTSDCPLIDPGVIDDMIEYFTKADPPVDYISNTHSKRTFPRGLDVEVISMDALKKAWEWDMDPSLREHVTPYIQRHPEEFSHETLVYPEDHSKHRWTIDTTEDFQLVSKIYGHFENDGFEWQEVLTLIEQNPEWVKLNQKVRQKGIS